MTMSSIKLDKKEILHLAHLARLQLTDAEIEKIGTQLTQTIDYIKNLDELDTSNTLPTNSVVDLKNVMYEDGEQSEISLSPQDAIKNAKKTKDNEFVVERIMEE